MLSSEWDVLCLLAVALGSGIAPAKIVELVLAGPLDLDVLLGLLEDVMLAAGYDFKFESETSGFVSGYVFCYG